MPIAGIVARRYLAGLMSIAFGLAGCTTGSGAMLAAAQTAMLSGVSKAPAVGPTINLDPRFRYLRLTTLGQTLFPVLGFIDGETEVWYTASGEVIRLRNGRLSETAGLPSDWRGVLSPAAPPWSGIGQTKAEYVRKRDVSPGYLFSVTDNVLATVSSAPTMSSLLGIAPTSLVWFEEVASTDDQRAKLPVARFGVDMTVVPPKVVYSEQCISNSLCLQIQEWSAAQQSAIYEKALKP